MLVERIIVHRPSACYSLYVSCPLSVQHVCFFLFKYSPFSNSFGVATECGNNYGKLTNSTNCLRNSSSPNKLTDNFMEFKSSYDGLLAFLWKNGTYLNDKFWKLKWFSSIFDSNQRNEKLFRWLASLWLREHFIIVPTYGSQWFIQLLHLFQPIVNSLLRINLLNFFHQNIVVCVFFDNSLFKSLSTFNMKKFFFSTKLENSWNNKIQS